MLRRVRNEVRAVLVQASLFGSRARRAARPDSDLDILLIFRYLSPSREPQATRAERIAEEIAVESGVPLSVWCISLADLERGRRTPMLIDALEDSIPIWCAGRPVGRVPFTAEDALFCAEALLRRVEEGGEGLAHAVAHGREREAARRARDDVARACTAWLLLHGVTRPRRAAAVREFARRAGLHRPLSPATASLLAWATRSWGPDGHDDDWPVRLPPGGVRGVGPEIDLLRLIVRDAIIGLEARIATRRGMSFGPQLAPRVDEA